jgi:DNA-binding HxlR family transcriptional regulator
MDTHQERKNLFVRNTPVPAFQSRQEDVPALQSRQEDVPALSAPAESAPLAHAGCRNVAPVLNRVGDKWSMLIVMILSDGPRRFNELKRLVDGISQRMLTLSLRGLERDGLVTRKVTPSIPPRVDYALSELGQSLREPVSVLGEWAIAHIACIRAAQVAFDARGDAYERTAGPSVVAATGSSGRAPATGLGATERTLCERATKCRSTR